MPQAMTEAATIDHTNAAEAATDVGAMSDADLDAALRSTESGPGSTEPEPQQAQPEDDGGDAEASAKASKEPKDGTVNHGALHEERMRRKNVEAELAETRRQAADTLRALREEAIALRARYEPAQQAPDPASDPLGAMYQGQQTLAQKLDAIERRMSQGDEQAQAAQVVTSVVTAAQSSEAEFRAKTPDYDRAVATLQQQRMRELATLGVHPQEAQRRIVAEAVQVSDYALRRGESPAEVMYRLAQARGYVPEARKLEMQQEGQKASRPTGSTAAPKIGIEALLSMDADEFDKVAGDPKAWKRLAGG